MGVGILSPRPERGRRFFRYPPSPPALTRLPARISQPGPHPQPRRLGRIALAPPPQIRHSRHSQNTNCPQSLGNPTFAVNSLLNLPPDRRRVAPSLRPPFGGQISREEPPGPQPERRSPSRFLSKPCLSCTPPHASTLSNKRETHRGSRDPLQVSTSSVSIPVFSSYP